MSEDYYAALGLERGASEDDIRKAYKKAAIKDHPDRNPGDKAAEERFKKANEAYAVLSDPEKKSHYDRWGSGGPPQGGGWPGGGDPFSSFQEIFSDMFGGGRRRQQPTGPLKGEDIRVVQGISFGDSLLGCTKEISLDLPSSCGDCGGSGAKKGTSRSKCGGCGGSGQVVIQQGFMSISHPCGRCGGRGDVAEKPCDRCHGGGMVAKKKKMNVTFPPGVAHGQQLRISGGGIASSSGGPPGDVYVIVEVETLSNWRREGNDLVTMQLVGFSTAAMGGIVPITLPGGEKVDVVLAPGSQPGVESVVAGKGAPDIRRPKNRGNLRVIINVKIPEVKTERGKILLGALEKELLSPGG